MYGLCFFFFEGYWAHEDLPVQAHSFPPRRPSGLRLARLEELLGVQMFEKLPSGYRLTAAGEEVRELATQMETSSLQLETRVFGRDQSVRGLLRVTLTPLLATHLLMPDLTDFARLHPDIEKIGRAHV